MFESIYKVEDKRLEKELFGLKFPNPVGLAAGFDKQASFYKESIAWVSIMEVWKWLEKTFRTATEVSS